jgi:hypothetical protein
MTAKYVTTRKRAPSPDAVFRWVETCPGRRRMSAWRPIADIQRPGMLSSASPAFGAESGTLALGNRSIAFGANDDGRSDTHVPMAVAPMHSAGLEPRALLDRFVFRQSCFHSDMVPEGGSAFHYSVRFLRRRLRFGSHSLLKGELITGD